MKVVLASHNVGKIRELTTLLNDLYIDLIPQAALGVSDIEETGHSFIENALIKARHASLITGLPAISDDSGLVVAALKGAPGIYSARYAGEKATANDNIHKVLSDLKEVPDDQRNAYFYCVLVYLSSHDDPHPLVCEGKWPGVILRAPQGTDGFGYDPIFYVPSEKKTAAELSPTVKNKISHRGIALQSLLTYLADKI